MPKTDAVDGVGSMGNSSALLDRNCNVAFIGDIAIVASMEGIIIIIEKNYKGSQLVNVVVEVLSFIHVLAQKLMLVTGTFAPMVL